jgi:hypothetical protein
MRYSPALVLSTLAIGQAAAGTIRHAGFHARRHAEQKRDEVDYVASVDWKKIAESADYTKVDWSKVNYDSSSSSAAPYAAPSASASPPPASSSKVVKVETPSKAATYAAPAPPAETPKVVKANKQVEAAGAFVNGLIDDITDWFGELGIGSLGVNSDSNNGQCWLGDDGQYTATFKNNADKDVVLVCWKDMGFTINTVQPLLTVKLPSGKAQKVSFGSVSGACAPVYKGMAKSTFGGPKETWIEWTFGGGFPTFDVSREPYMKGLSISATAQNSKCVSDMETCVFKCKNGADSCGQAGEYGMFNTDRLGRPTRTPPAPRTPRTARPCSRSSSATTCTPPRKT